MIEIQNLHIILLIGSTVGCSSSSKSNPCHGIYDQANDICDWLVAEQSISTTRVSHDANDVISYPAYQLFSQHKQQQLTANE
jgi:hypothetical protein